jgi:hypothetical protein
MRSMRAASGERGAIDVIRIDAINAAAGVDHRSSSIRRYDYDSRVALRAQAGTNHPGIRALGGACGSW